MRLSLHPLVNSVSFFPTEDVNLGLVRYVLHEEKIHEMMDSFQFLVKDSKPNVVSDNIFHIQWSLISFKYTRYRCCRCSFLRNETGKQRKPRCSTLEVSCNHPVTMVG